MVVGKREGGEEWLPLVVEVDDMEVVVEGATSMWR
jgi:hypothetical protein